MFKFDVWDSTGKIRRKANINCIPSCSVKIDTSLYKPKTSVHYEQTKAADVNYVSIVSANGKWLHCQNQTLLLFCVMAKRCKRYDFAIFRAHFSKL